MTLENRTIVISGATGGLGAVIAKELAGKQVNLALLGKDPERLENLGNSLAIPESRIFTRSVDLLDAKDTISAAESINLKYGKVDVLLHVVGGWTGGKTIVESTAEDLSFMLEQHIWTSYNVTRAFIPYLVNNGWGRIIMVTSPFASRPNAKGGPYAIGKVGQETLMLTLAQELKDTGVTANLLQVKTIDLKHEKITAPSTRNSSWTTPEELVFSILYLISEEARMVNGAKIPLYGLENPL